MDVEGVVSVVVILPILGAAALYMALRPEAAYRSMWFAPEMQPSEWKVTVTRVTGIFGLAVVAIATVTVMVALISN